MIFGQKSKKTLARECKSTIQKPQDFKTFATKAMIKLICKYYNIMKNYEPNVNSTSVDACGSGGEYNVANQT